MIIELVLPALIGFIVTLFITPPFIRKFKAMGITGKDIHKKERPDVAEMGGVPIIIGFIIGYIFVAYFFITNLVELSAIFATILLAGLIGIIDDKGGMRQRVKAFLPAFAAIPLMLIQAGHHTMMIPFFGSVDFGIIYPLILIPLAITVVSNAFNLLAGYNGLEAGIGLISCFFMGVASFITGNIMVASFLFCLSGILLAFLRYNKYPAKIFTGDSGVFIIGSAIAAAAILSNLEVVGIILLILYIVNGAMVVYGLSITKGRPRWKFSKLSKEGTLIPPPYHYEKCLYFFIEKHFNMTEKRLVATFWSIQIIFGLIAVLMLVF